MNYLCYSLSYENVLFRFIFLPVFSVFSLYTFLFYFVLSLIFFSVSVVLCARASKTSDGVLQSFYYKIKGKGEFVQRGK